MYNINSSNSASVSSPLLTDVIMKYIVRYIKSTGCLNASGMYTVPFLTNKCLYFYMIKEKH